MALVLPATAQASPHSYRLKGKKCKHGYARKVRHVKGHRQVWCVRRKPAPHAVAPAPAGPTATQTIVTAVNSSGSPLPGQPSYISVGVNVRAAGQELNGYPVRLQIDVPRGPPSGQVSSYHDDHTSAMPATDQQIPVVSPAALPRTEIGSRSSRRAI